MTYRTLVLLVGLMLSSILFAQEKATDKGVIESIEADKSGLIINDQYYRLSLGMKILDERERSTNRFKLNPGMFVAFSAERLPSGQLSIIRIWLAPENIQLDEEED